MKGFRLTERRAVTKGRTAAASRSSSVSASGLVEVGTGGFHDRASSVTRRELTNHLKSLKDESKATEEEPIYPF